MADCERAVIYPIPPILWERFSPTEVTPSDSWRGRWRHKSSNLAGEESLHDGSAVTNKVKLQPGCGDGELPRNSSGVGEPPTH